jgi:hypothetical protein
MLSLGGKVSQERISDAAASDGRADPDSYENLYHKSK